MLALGHSTWLFHPTMALLHTTIALLRSAWIYFILPLVYFITLDFLPLLYTSLYTWLYFISVIFILLNTTSLYPGSTPLYYSLYFTLLNFISFYQGSTLLDSASFHHPSTSLYLNLIRSTMALVHSTLHFALALLVSTSHYLTFSF